MSGDQNDFDIPTYTASVAGEFLVDISRVTVTIGTTRRRRLQASFTVNTAIVAESASIATTMQERVQNYATSLDAFTSNLMQGQTVTVASIAVAEITSVVIYSPPPAPPSPPPTGDGTLGGNTIAGQNAGGSGGSSGDNSVIIVIIVAIAAVVIAGLFAFAVRRYIINKRTSTIVKAVPVTTNTQAQADVTSVSASTAAKPAEMEMDESKI
jgi:flagellar basal body-associated protein FliL